MFVLHEFIVLLVRLAVYLCHAEHAFATVTSIVYLVIRVSEAAHSSHVIWVDVLVS